MATWTPITKHTAHFDNLTKHTSVFENQPKHTSVFTPQSKTSSAWNLISCLLLENGGELHQENNFRILVYGSPGDKHYSDWSNQTKH